MSEALRKMEFQTKMIGAGSYLRIAYEAELAQKQIESVTQERGPIGREFFALEKRVMEKFNGTIPDWVKDDRNWRELDKEFLR